jgi:DNA-binding XRE family transcriptional regulator
VHSLALAAQHIAEQRAADAAASLGRKLLGEGVSMVSRVKEIREKAGYSQSEAAALADCAPNTWRIWEVNQDAVSPRVRAKCETATNVMAAKAEAA